MCLILFAWHVHPDHPLIVAANRDEYFARSTEVARFWPEAPQLLAGRDLEAGGTWMGITRSGRFAALTNYRDRAHVRPTAPSRGKLVAEFLSGQESAPSYLDRIAALGNQCNGYNLLVGDLTGLWWSSNVNGERRKLEPGVYGVSNHLLDTPWPKLAEGKAALIRAIDPLLEASFDSQPLFEMLQNDRIHPDHDLPDTGIGLAYERLLSSAFIKSPTYGTRSSTVLAAHSNGWVDFDEQTWFTGGIRGTRVRFRYERRGE